jgi:tetratricopeptide (TPR) repeat protein
MHRAFVSGVAFLILALGACPASLAQDGATVSVDWDTCAKSPTRACLLDEALLRALSVRPAASSQVGSIGEIAEMQASGGHIETALRIAHSIPPDQKARVTALDSIGRAQATLGLTNEAKDTFAQAHQLASSLADQLDGAEALLSVAKAEAEAAMATDAVSIFAESLQRAEALEIRASSSSTCMVFPSPEQRLDGLLKAIAEQQARAGNIADALQTARSIKYFPHIRVEALRTIGELRAQSGAQSEAAPILKEALAAARASQSPPEHWPSCPHMHYTGASAEFYAEMLCTISETQAKTGQIEDAAATLETALQLVPTIKDGPLWKADVSRSLALSAIAEAQSEVGLKPQSVTSFARAAQAASEVREPQHRIMALTKLARAQHRDGRVNDSIGTFDEALAVARTLENMAERANSLLSIVDAKVDLGLATDADGILAAALDATRSIPDKSKRVALLSRIAGLHQKAGRLQDGVATYAEALDGLDATDSEWQRTNSLFSLIRGWPGHPLDPRLLAASAPRVIRIADSINGKRRSEALILIAKALPN